MAKFVYALLVLTALFCRGSAKPLITDDDIAKVAAEGDWQKVQDLLKEYVQSRLSSVPTLAQTSGPKSGSLLENGGSFPPVISGGSSPGGRYFSQSEYSYQRSTNNNGVVMEDKGGLGMIDDNGRVSYYKPNHSQFPIAQGH